MSAYSYIVKRDYGFAPNPFHGFITLATCKPTIRKGAQVGDIIMGFSSKDSGNKLIFILKVSAKISFDDYWNNPAYRCKRPVMNGSLVMQYGDNIYHHDKDGNWIQEDSHHSYIYGVINKDNLKRDTGTTDRVLFGTDFIYLGKSMIAVPNEYKELIYDHVGQKKVDEEKAVALWGYLKEKYPEQGLIDDPNHFDTFERYNGK